VILLRRLLLNTKVVDIAVQVGVRNIEHRYVLSATSMQARDDALERRRAAQQRPIPLHRTTTTACAFSVSFSIKAARSFTNSPSFYFLRLSQLDRRMRLSSVPLVLAGASLAIQAGASPLRVVVVSSHQEVSTNNAHSNAEANIVAAGPALVPGVGMMRVDHKSSVQSGEHIRAHHCGGSVRDTVKDFVNKIFGFSGGERPHAHAAIPEHPHPEPGRVSILPWFGPPKDGPPREKPDRVSILPWFGTPNGYTDVLNDTGAVETDGEGRVRHHSRPPMMTEGAMDAKHGQEDVGPVRIVHMSGEEGPRRRFRHHHGPFLRRMHFALMALGPWEGRAVAFVLGCGIGVLLRMVWVMGVVLARTISGSRSDDAPEAVFDADAEEILVAPPQYSQFPDEKAPAVVEEKPQAA